MRSQEIERHITQNATRGLQPVPHGIAHEEGVWGQQSKLKDAVWSVEDEGRRE